MAWQCAAKSWVVWFLPLLSAVCIPSHNNYIDQCRIKAICIHIKLYAESLRHGFVHFQQEKWISTLLNALLIFNLQHLRKLINWLNHYHIM